VTQNGVKYRGKNKGVLVQSFGYLRCLKGRYARRFPYLFRCRSGDFCSDFWNFVCNLFGGVFVDYFIDHNEHTRNVYATFYVLFFVSILVVGIIGAFIGGLWTHIWVYLVGGRKGVAQTIKAVMYGATPSFLLAFLPWAVIVQVIGIRQLQELSTGRAILAVIFAIIIPMIIIVAIIATFMPPIPGPVFPGPTGPGFGGF
jgi:hypothetical protein